MNLNIAIPVGDISLTPDGVFCPEHGLFPFDEYGCPECRIAEADAIEAGADYCEQHGVIPEDELIFSDCGVCFNVQFHRWREKELARGMCPSCGGRLTPEEGFVEDGFHWWCENCEGLF